MTSRNRLEEHRASRAVAQLEEEIEAKDRPNLLVSKSPTENRVISTSIEGVKVWCTRMPRKMRLVKVLKVLDEIQTVRSITMLDNETAMFADDDYVKVIDLNDGDVLDKVKIDEPCRVCARIDENTAIFGDDSSSIYRATWDGNYLDLICIVDSAHEIKESILYMRSNRNYFITVANNEVRLWNSDTNDLIYCFDQDEFVTTASFNDHYLISCWKDLSVYDLSTFELVNIIELTDPIMIDICEEKNIAIVFEYHHMNNSSETVNVMRLFSIPDGQLIGEYWPNADYAYSYTILNDGRVVLGGRYEHDHSEMVQLINVKQLRR